MLPKNAVLVLQSIQHVVAVIVNGIAVISLAVVKDNVLLK